MTKTKLFLAALFACAGLQCANADTIYDFSYSFANSPHTVTGSISKDGDSYVLKVSDTTSYKLDDQAKAKEFDGQKVRVTGEVDLNRNFIHVQKIEPLA